MRKIVSLFQRNYDGDRLVRDEVVPGAEWVLAGEGVATRKFDGACCAILNGVLHKRYDAKQGKEPPPGFIPAQDYDPITGHMPGWLEVGNGSEDRWFREGCERTFGKPFTGPDGTYELCGPKVQGNPEGYPDHILVPHGQFILEGVPRNYADLRAYLEPVTIEGIVWHHPDGRMVKIKRKDFFPKQRSA